MTQPYYEDEAVTLWHGDALEVLQGMPDGSVDCCVTSPPYFGLRDYGVAGQYGLESSPVEYVATMARLFAEVRRVLSDGGTLWLNLGDSYSGGDRGSYDPGSHLSRGVPTVRPVTGVPAKNLLGMPWRVAFALQDDGWTLRNAIVWHKPNAMPDSVRDRLACRYEQVFLLSKSRRYWFDLDPIKVPTQERASGKKASTGADYNAAVREGARRFGGNDSSTLGTFQQAERNPGDVWTIPTSPFPGAHFACMPLTLAERCVQAGCKPGGTVLDPFSGSGTTGLAATRNGHRYVGIDLNAEYLDLSLRTRLSQGVLDFSSVSEGQA